MFCKAISMALFGDCADTKAPQAAAASANAPPKINNFFFMIKV
jgi:hypothetical protein